MSAIISSNLFILNGTYIFTSISSEQNDLKIIDLILIGISVMPINAACVGLYTYHN